MKRNQILFILRGLLSWIREGHPVVVPQPASQISLAKTITILIGVLASALVLDIFITITRVLPIAIALPIAIVRLLTIVITKAKLEFLH